MLKKLLGWYKGLPPQAQMLVALAGLGTPATALYFVKQKLFPGVSMPMFVLGVAVVVAVLIGVAELISRIFASGAKKRSKKLATELTEAGGSGPSSMDVRAAIKSNNDKFNAAVQEMRKNLNVSVYDLPWYIVIGDSGCGKTKLVNESGLTFSTGKPEGYQLGTLNYNWWFTEDAIFIDMAGRLCNPTDDADRREWEGVLGTIARGRKGFPINGAIVCVSAEHLLQDPPEKHETDANTALERLRDLQAKLGVTFATYLVVTKCDKVLGFMQYFDRAERDITIKNQIFGWSRPGEFNQLYDPEHFTTDFDGVYHRLNELRLRRLNDEADEQELGLAYAFPEEFRELKAPLQTYVRTLFPMIKNPRGIKNLIFRGVFFTSATQQGGVILKHLSERLGAAAAENFPPLESLYPRPRPHFAKDLWLRKVFPEHGLVFRNEEQVMRNKKMSKLLKVGSVALFLLLFSTMGLGIYKFSDRVGKPTSDAIKTHERKIMDDPKNSLVHASVIDQDATDLEAGLAWARFIMPIGNVREPVHKLRDIRDGLYVKRVLPAVMEDAAAALRDGRMVGRVKGAHAYRSAEEEQGAGRVFRDAVKTFVAWYAASKGDKYPADDANMNADAFLRMSQVIDTAGSPAKESNYSACTRQCFADFGSAGVENPARVMSAPAIQARKTIVEAIGHVRSYLAAFATVDDKNPDDVVGEWMRIHTACADAQKSYAELLALAKTPVASMEDFEAARKRFLDLFGRLDRDLTAAVQWRAMTGKPGVVKVPPLRDRLLDVRRLKWSEYSDKLKQAFSGAGSPDDPVGPAIAALRDTRSDAQRPGLDSVFWKSLRDAGLVKNPDAETSFDPALFPRLVMEVDDADSNVIVLKRNTDDFTSDSLTLSDAARQAREYLRPLSAALSATDEKTGDMAGASVEKWLDVLEAEPTAIATASAPVGLTDAWKPTELHALGNTVRDWLMRGVGTRVLRSITRTVGQVAEAPWGFAAIYPDCGKPNPSRFSIPLPAKSTVVPEKPVTKEEPVTPKPKRRRFDLGGTGLSGGTSISANEQGGGMQVPACATPAFVQEHGIELARLLSDVEELDAERYLAEMSGNASLKDRCLDTLRRGGQRYADDYAAAWSQAYANYPISELDVIQKEPCDWSTLAGRVADGTPSGHRAVAAKQIRESLAAILHNTRWACSKDGVDWKQIDTDFGRYLAREVGGMFDRAFDRRWDAANGQFWQRASLGAAARQPGRMPWDMIAEDVSTTWLDIAEAMGRNQSLPGKFTSDLDERARPPIPWARLAELRDRNGLTDELITKRMAQFTRRSQDLLSMQLSTVLYRIQKDYFGSDKPYEGWPYLEAADDNMATVKFDTFKKFLREMQSATKVLGPLEDGLPEDAIGYKERKKFYESCRLWNKFVQPNEQGKASSLEVITWVGDPLDERLPPSLKLATIGGVKPDTPQHYFEFAYLKIGLLAKQNSGQGAKPPDPQRIPTTAGPEKAKERPGVWDWPVDYREPVTLQLTGGHDEAKDREPKQQLGRSSPLGLCALLHRYGAKNVPGYEEKWVTVYRLNDVELSDRKHNFGVMMVFHLDRPMPDPIVPLRQTESDVPKRHPAESAGSDRR